jgi:hypothetical protein
MEQRIKTPWICKAIYLLILCFMAWIVGNGVGAFFAWLTPNETILDTGYGTVVETFYTTDRYGNNSYYVAFEVELQDEIEFGILEICDGCYIKYNKTPQIWINKILREGLGITEYEFSNEHNHSIYRH